MGMPESCSATRAGTCNRDVGLVREKNDRRVVGHFERVAARSSTPMRLTGGTAAPEVGELIAESASQNGRPALVRRLASFS